MHDVKPTTAAEWARQVMAKICSPRSCLTHWHATFEADMTEALNAYARQQVEAALERAAQMVRGHAKRIAEADKGKKWPTKETAGDVGLLIAVANEIEKLTP